MSRQARAFSLVSSEVRLRTPIFSLRVDQAAHPTSGEVGSYFVLESPDWVNVVAETPAGELVLVRQWRHGSRSIELEIPGGLVDQGEDTLRAAARELREETGYEPGRLEVLGTMRPNPAFMRNTCTMLWARDCRQVAAPEPDEDEDLEVVIATREQVERWLLDGTIAHGVVQCALFHWLRRSGHEACRG